MKTIAVPERPASTAAIREEGHLDSQNSLRFERLS
jgi:hypothetical protein